MRTFFDVELIFGMPLSSHKQELFAAFPFDYKRPDFPNLRTLLEKSISQEMRALHPIHKAIAWKKILTENTLITTAQIAECEGMSQHHLRALIRLTRLAPEIQDFLKNLTESPQIRFFGEKNLRLLTPLSQVKQREYFEAMQETWNQRV